MPYFDIVCVAVCAVFYYHLGEQEYERGILVAAVSALLWMGPAFLLGWGLLACIAVQAGLYVALTIFNMRRHRGPAH